MTKRKRKTRTKAFSSVTKAHSAACRVRFFCPAAPTKSPGFLLLSRTSPGLLCFSVSSASRLVRSLPSRVRLAFAPLWLRTNTASSLPCAVRSASRTLLSQCRVRNTSVRMPLLSSSRRDAKLPVRLALSSGAAMIRRSFSVVCSKLSAPRTVSGAYELVLLSGRAGE